LTEDRRDVAREAIRGEEELRLSSETTRKLKEIARRNKITMNTIVQGIWGILLSRYSRQEDVVFGVTVSGRPAELKGIEKMIGLFINTLPARLRVKEEKAAIEWLKELQERQQEMMQYQYSPLVEIQRLSEVGRGKGLFDSIL